MNTSHLDEPTGGTVQDDFYFVAGSQGHRFDGPSAPEVDELIEPTILRIRLNTR